MYLSSWSTRLIGRMLCLLFLPFFGTSWISCGSDRTLPGATDKTDETPTTVPKTNDKKPNDKTTPLKKPPIINYDPFDIVEQQQQQQGKDQVVTVDLGKIDFSNGESAPFTVDIPKGAIAFVVVIAGHPGVTYMVKELKNPKGTVLAAGLEMGKHLNRVMPGIIGGSAAFMVPNTPDIAQHFVPGKYSFALQASVTKGFTSAPDNNPAIAKAFIKMGPAPTMGTIDINILCTGAQGITAANAPTHPRIKHMLEGWADLYAQANIKLGKVKYYDHDPVFKKLESIQGADSDLARACRATKNMPIAVNVLLTDGISMGGLLGGVGTIMGISGGIPGTVMWNGLESSCLAINLTTPPQFDKDLAPITVAHETGHFLGLFHSSENFLAALSGMKHDPISDTPENDKNNVMFNNPMEATKPYFSRMQSIVMLSNPLVY